MLLTLNLDGAASTGVLDSTTTKALVPSLHNRLASTRGSLDACMHVSVLYKAVSTETVCNQLWPTGMLALI